MEIPKQKPLSWAIVCRVSWAGVRRRLVRSMVTLSCVALAIAFVAYMLLLEDITAGLVRVNSSELNVLLQEKGVDIFAEPGADSMTVLLLSLALITCTVGILNSMLMSVAERVREIGTLKCLGARDMFIVKTYFFEATLQGVFGSLVGMLMGAGVAIGILALDYPGFVFSYFPLTAVARSLGVAFACGLVISVVAAIAPAYAAARKQPVDALRVEE